MRIKLLNAVRAYFPDSRVYMVDDRIILVRGSMYTTYIPDEALWDKPFSDSDAVSICKQLENVQTYEVSGVFDDEQPARDGGSVPV